MVGGGVLLQGQREVVRGPQHQLTQPGAAHPAAHVARPAGQVFFAHVSAHHAWLRCVSVRGEGGTERDRH